MFGRIPWERYSGEEVENVIATYILRQHLSAVRIRPSQGDHGIDVIDKMQDGTYVVYQVKRFARNLKSSEKRQIRDSLDTLLAYMEDTGYILKEWHLVLPLDPTPEDYEWFHTLAPDMGFEMLWDGLTRIDGWIASMPEIADYWLSPRREWAFDLIRLHMTAIGMHSHEELEELEQRLSAVQDILDRTDPNYRYAVHLMPEGQEFDILQIPAPQPNLIMSYIYERPGVGLLQIDVFARSPALAALHPIHGRITFLPKDESERKQVEDFLDYGVPISSCTARCIVLDSPLACLNSEDENVGVLSMFTHDEAESSPSMYLTTGDDPEDIVELAMFRISRSSGEKGAQTVFSDDSRIVSIRFRMRNDGSLEAVPTITTENLEGCDCSAVKMCLEFLLNSYENGTATVLYGGTVVSKWSMSLKEDMQSSIETLHELSCSIEAIGACAHTRIPFPNVEKMTRKEHVDIVWKGRIAMGEVLVSTWRKAPFRMASRKDLELDFPIIIRWLRSETVTIAGVAYELGYSENIIVAGSMAKEQNGESIVFLPREADGDACLIHLLPSRQMATDLTDQLFWTTFDSTIWEEAIDSASSH